MCELHAVPFLDAPKCSPNVPTVLIFGLEFYQHDFGSQLPKRFLYTVLPPAQNYRKLSRPFVGNKVLFYFLNGGTVWLDRRFDNVAHIAKRWW